MFATRELAPISYKEKKPNIHNLEKAAVFSIFTPKNISNVLRNKHTLTEFQQQHVHK